MSRPSIPGASRYLMPWSHPVSIQLSELDILLDQAGFGALLA